MPGKGTPLRTIRVAPALWAKAKAKAGREETTLTAVLVARLEQYVADDRE